MTAPPPTAITRWKRARITLDEVERYLSQMCADGWAPVSVTFGNMVNFARTEPGQYVCASAATVKVSGVGTGLFDRKKYAELAALLEAQGAFVVPQRLTGGEQEGIIAVRRADQGPLAIHSDTDSRVEDLRARIRHRTVFALAFLVLASLSLTLDIISSTSTGGYLLIGVFFLFVAVEYGRPIYKYAAEAKRLKRNREVFE